MKNATQSQPHAAGEAEHKKVFLARLYVKDTPEGPSLRDVTDGSRVAECYLDVDAQEIAHCCNSHAALVEALDSLMKNVDMQRGAGERMLTLHFNGDCLTKCAAALAAAKGGAS